MSIRLTANAADRVRAFLALEKGLGLRLGVRKTGCSGWAYEVELAKYIDPDDIVFEDQDVKIVVAPEFLDFLDGSTIDFSARGLGMAFLFENPNATEQCGCGESFTVKSMPPTPSSPGA